MKYVYEGGCYRLYADNMLLGIIKKYIADYDEELVKMSKINEALLHITTDLTYVSQDALNADEDIINFQNGILKITASATLISSRAFLIRPSLPTILEEHPVRTSKSTMETQIMLFIFKATTSLHLYYTVYRSSRQVLFILHCTQT